MAYIQQHQCNAYWAEAKFLPISAIVDYWCEGDPNCHKAKFFALIAACEDGEIEYARSDGKPFQDPVLDLANRDILLIHRASFEKWIEKFPENKAGDILPMRSQTETVYLNIIGALIETITGKDGSGRPLSRFDSQTKVIEYLIDNFPGATGISQRSLENKFSDGKRSLAVTPRRPASFQPQTTVQPWSKR
ncbi:MAG: hypothetical protein HQL91_13805 [Magnetococcales bacterium]|nr:hypothetical protein [Magnetococcales bacterium]